MPEPQFDCWEECIELRSWAAYILLLPHAEQPTLHVIGVNQATGRNRISSPVLAVHVSAQRLMTCSRRYDLLGEPGTVNRSLAILKVLTADWHAELLGNMTRRLFDPVRFHASHLALAPKYFQ